MSRIKNGTLLCFRRWQLHLLRWKRHGIPTCSHVSPGTLSRVGTSNRLTLKQTWRAHRRTSFFSSQRIMDSGNAQNEMPGLQTEKGTVWTQEFGGLLPVLLQQARFGCRVQTYLRELAMRILQRRWAAPHRLCGRHETQRPR